MIARDGDDDQAHDHDVIVVGAGPAGTSAATIIAGYGHRVLVLERKQMPRYRIGESLIPYCWFPLQRLGVVEKLDQSAFVIPKHSVQFVGTDGRRTTPFYFFEHTDHPCARTWQVVRSAFDAMLLEHAVERGAAVVHETARDLVHDGDAVVGVRTTDADGTERERRAKLVIDASGRELFAATRKGWRIADPHLKKIAVWAYFTGGKREAGLDEGATTVAYLPDKGWFWHIPLPEDTVSVGVVAERDYLYRGPRDPQQILDREIQTQPWIREHLAGATQQGACQVTGDYSYRSRHCAADGLVLVGDAFAFLDPVFSSGVFLALECGVHAGDAAHAALAAGDVSAARFDEYGARCREGLEAMRRLVHAFYDTTFSFGKFLKEHPDHRGALTDCLIGNVHRDLEPLFDAVGRYADVPAPLPHGRPLVSDPTP